MSQGIRAVRKEEYDIIVVTADDGSEIRYMMENGILHAGRLWRIFHGGHEITLFLLFPDGVPRVLGIDDNDDPPF